MLVLNIYIPHKEPVLEIFEDEKKLASFLTDWAVKRDEQLKRGGRKNDIYAFFSEKHINEGLDFRTVSYPLGVYVTVSRLTYRSVEAIDNYIEAYKE